MNQTLRPITALEVLALAFAAGFSIHAINDDEEWMELCRDDFAKPLRLTQRPSAHVVRTLATEAGIDFAKYCRDRGIDPHYRWDDEDAHVSRNGRAVSSIMATNAARDARRRKMREAFEALQRAKPHTQTEIRLFEQIGTTSHGHPIIKDEDGRVFVAVDHKGAVPE